MSNTIWEPLHHPIIEDGYLISPFGDIRGKDVDESQSFKATYHATNGYDFALFVIKEQYRIKGNPVRLFPIDEIIAMVYIPVPSELEGKRLTVRHINGDTRDISLENLEWVEDIEIWKDVTYPGVEPNRYQVSNHGRVRNKKMNKILYGHNNEFGYIIIYLYKTNRDLSLPPQYHYRGHPMHRIVAYEFLKKNKKFMKLDVNHIDGIKTNEYFKNLEIVDRITNNHHAYFTKLNDPKTCEGSNHASITNRECEIICEKIIEHKGHMKEILHDLHDMGIKASRSIVSLIICKYSWTDISDKYFKKDEFRQILTESEVRKVCESLLKHKNEFDNTDIVYNELKDEIPNLTQKIVYTIRDKESHRKISDQYFSKEEFRRVINEKEARLIINLLVKYKGMKNRYGRIVQDLKHSIPLININTVRNIAHKRSFRRLSDKYF